MTRTPRGRCFSTRSSPSQAMATRRAAGPSAAEKVHPPTQRWLTPQRPVPISPHTTTKTSEIGHAVPAQVDPTTETSLRGSISRLASFLICGALRSQTSVDADYRLGMSNDLAPNRVLEYWSDYEAFSKQVQDDPAYRRIFEIATRFHSRWLLVTRFQGLNAPGYSEISIQGYNALFRVMLAYSVIDEFRATTGCKNTINSILDRELANKLRANLSIERITSNEKTTRTNFQDINETSDVLKFATALRHMASHGSGTAYGVIKYRDSGWQVMNDLADKLLDEVEQAFVHWAHLQITTYRV